jgi:pantoate--beta-alanine ligase
MFAHMETVTTVAALRAEIASYRGAGARIGLVPTMGALHAGHLSLVRETQKRTDRAVVSIFVNPAQFAPHEDFDRYPRDLKSDSEKLAAEGVDLVFAPATAELYPERFSTRIDVGGPSAGLETDFRPHFFAGVAMVVAKLLIAALPDLATFGEKDYQQLLVVRQLVHDLGLPVEIFGAPIVREGDGLAMSSRNAYLTSSERAIAARLNAVLRDTIARVVRDGSIEPAEAFAVESLQRAGFASVDYVAIRDGKTLSPIKSLVRPARILAAAHVGSTRLIDNMAIESPSP